MWKRKNKTGQPSGRCRARGRNGKCCNFDGHSPDLVPSSRCGDDTEGLFCRCLPATWLWGQWRSVLVMPLVPRLHAGSRHRPRLAHRRGGRSKWAHCRGSEETSPRFVAVGRGGVSKPMPFYDGGCGALLTCVGAKLGRKGRKSKPQGEKCVVVNRFFVRIKVALSKQRRKSCGVSAHGGGLFVGMVHSFLLLPCVSFRAEGIHRGEGAHIACDDHALKGLFRSELPREENVFARRYRKRPLTFR